MGSKDAKLLERVFFILFKIKDEKLLEILLEND